LTWTAEAGLLEPKEEKIWQVLCSHCVLTVFIVFNNNESMDAKMAGSLPRSKKVLEHSTWSILLSKIPFVSAKKEKRRLNSSQDDNPAHNNYLLKLLKRNKK
jgi:hypothetical protein